MKKKKSSDPLSEDKLTAIYLLDKDLLVVGYQKIPAGGGPVTILINSVINYLRVYIECTQHGLWLEELAIPR